VTMEQPKRVQLSRIKGWRMPENTVKVDRSTRWGNPWTEENSGNIHPVLRFICETVPLMDVSPLRGKNLACWCALDADCHADMLLAFANSQETE
jgi:hypothetical protein